MAKSRHAMAASRHELPKDGVMKRVPPSKLREIFLQYSGVGYVLTYSLVSLPLSERQESSSLRTGFDTTESRLAAATRVVLSDYTTHVFHQFHKLPNLHIWLKMV